MKIGGTTVKITSYEEFERRLRGAIPRIDAIIVDFPERELISIQKQLHALEEWTRGGIKPTDSQRSSLNFGLLADRYLDDLDQPLAQELYALASYVIYW
jgi:hypothetical protein